MLARLFFGTIYLAVYVGILMYGLFLLAREPDNRDFENLGRSLERTHSNFSFPEGISVQRGYIERSVIKGVGVDAKPTGGCVSIKAMLEIAAAVLLWITNKHGRYTFWVNFRVALAIYYYIWVVLTYMKFLLFGYDYTIVLIIAFLMDWPFSLVSIFFVHRYFINRAQVLPVVNQPTPVVMAPGEVGPAPGPGVPEKEVAAPIQDLSATAAPATAAPATAVPATAAPATAVPATAAPAKAAPATAAPATAAPATGTDAVQH